MTKRSKLVCAAAIALAIFFNLNAQISYGGSPRFLNQKSIDSKAIVALSKINNDTYLDEDVAEKGSAMRVGVVQKVNFSNLKDGVTDILDNGDRIWRLTIKSEGATFMNTSFKTFNIPAGAELFIYDETKEFVLGKFTMESALEDGKFYTQSIPGDEITLEYYEPYEVAGKGVLEINEIGHGYKDIFQMMDFANEAKGPHGYADGDCHINVACPEGDEWRDQIRSVVHYQIGAGGYLYMCSGALINNTAKDKTNYVLSAHHCQDLNVSITSFVFYFNYQTTECEGRTGTYQNSVIGGDIIAKNSATDFLLLKIRRAIPESYNVHYAGWSRATTAPGIGAGIHHPGGDWKKISIPASVTSQNGNFWAVVWIAGDNNKGVTEQGSSGSPIFDANGRIVGQLYAGVSSCDNLSSSSALYDIYGKFNRSWALGTTAEKRLSDWLDPLGTNVMQLDGIDWNYEADSAVGINSIDAKNIMSVYPNPSSNGIFNIDIDEMGMAQYSIYDMMGHCVQTANIMLTSSTYKLKANLKQGSYVLEIKVNGKKYNKTIILR